MHFPKKIRIVFKARYFLVTKVPKELFFIQFGIGETKTQLIPTKTKRLCFSTMLGVFQLFLSE